MGGPPGLDGLGVGVHRVERDLVALVFGHLVVPDRLHGLDRLAHPTEATGRVGAVVLHLLDVPPGPDAEHEPPTRHHVVLVEML